MEDFITKGGQTYLRHYLLVEIALALVCSSRPSSAVKFKSTAMFLGNHFKVLCYATVNVNIIKHISCYTNLNFETLRVEINNFSNPQSCTILPSKMFRRM